MQRVDSSKDGGQRHMNMIPVCTCETCWVKMPTASLWGSDSKNETQAAGKWIKSAKAAIAPSSTAQKDERARTIVRVSVCACVYVHACVHVCVCVSGEAKQCYGHC